MIDALASATSRIARMSLDAYMDRYQVLSNNIANVDTTGYRPLQLNFEQQLAALQTAVASGNYSDSELIGLADAVHPFVEQAAVPSTQTDQAMRLDDQITQLTQNTLQYEALLTALDQLGSIGKLAVNGGAA
ncbi:flagellar basal body rod protein FlgB [Nevskia soli]|uniref:flagellar basal body rod protein FlgB n=1 Tax=Nevskia soli TaxID=418856 RepID=UPI00068C8D28|nr:flagellar basal body protein [Nevskia soli]